MAVNLVDGIEYDGTSPTFKSSYPNCYCLNEDK